MAFLGSSVDLRRMRIKEQVMQHALKRFFLTEKRENFPCGKTFQAWLRRVRRMAKTY